MTQETDVFIFHGISKDIDINTYYSEFIDGIRSCLPVGYDSSIRWHPVEYSHLLKDKEEAIYSWMKDMGHPKIRQIACDLVCDVLAMTHKDRPLVEGDFLFDFDRLVTAKYDKVNSVYPESRKIFIGHSLGSVLGYRFTYKRVCDTLITMCSPFLYFSVAYKEFGEMNPTLRKFVNFWKKYDVVSTIVSRNPKFQMAEDIQVKSFNPLNWFTAKAHSSIWTSNFVWKRIAKIITE